VSKNVAVFVDVANIFYAAKAAGVDIDYVTLLKSATAGRDLVRAYAYTGLDPDNENQRNFHEFLRRHGYKVVSKDIRKYGDGKVKANLDIELVVDMMKTARNLDIAIVVSGDGDFAPAIRAVQEMGVRCEVISFRGNTSSDLMDVADQFTDITHLARVEKGSSRSGRRVADDEEDLSMTEVPDKLSEGAGGGRGRSRGRGRGQTTEVEPVAATGRRPAPLAAVAASRTSLVALPGEKLSKSSVGAEGPDEEVEEVGEDIAEGGAVAAFAGDSAAAGEAGEVGEAGEDGRHRRRRRGGRGRGRGRGRADEAGVEIAAAEFEPDEEPLEPVDTIRRAPKPAAFGSVWDSQLGVPAAREPVIGPLTDEDFEEPAIPEYLIAERRQRDFRGGRGPVRGAPRGNRAGYAAAVDRERYGRGGGGGGINRYPDVSARERVGREAGFNRPDRSPRPAPRSVAPGGGAEPWSEVPPELEAMLRAQLATARPRPTEPRVTSAAPTPTDEGTIRETAPGTDRVATPETVETRAPARRRGTRAPAAVAETDASSTAEQVAAAEPTAARAPARASTRRTSTSTRPRAGTAEAAPEASGATESAAEAPKRRTTRATRSTAPASAAEREPGGNAPDDSPAAAEPADAGTAKPAARRRAPRKPAETTSA
jgi:uncharacterized LabA/DUF88 family protein